MLGRDGNLITGPGIATHAGFAMLDRKRAKATQFDPVTTGQGICDFVEHSRHNPLYITLIEMGIVLGDRLNQLGLDHGYPHSSFLVPLVAGRSHAFLAGSTPAPCFFNEISANTLFVADKAQHWGRSALLARRVTAGFIQFLYTSTA